jgi:hypothetical protein
MRANIYAFVCWAVSSVLLCAHAYADDAAPAVPVAKAAKAVATAAKTTLPAAPVTADADLASAALFGFAFGATMTGIRLLWKVRRVALGRA